MNKRTYTLLTVLLCCAAIAVAVKLLYPHARNWLRRETRPTQTVESVVATLGPIRRPQLEKMFLDAGSLYPPSQLTLIGLKREKRIEIWSPERSGQWKRITEYPVLAASGHDGPKLVEGDRQVPEGIYAIEGLNPNSHFHLSMKLNYPNEFDRRMAQQDGRSNLGVDIFIHGNAGSRGCLSISDDAIEELFLLVHDTGLERVRVIMTPYDMRKEAQPPSDGNPAWTADLYRNLLRELAAYRSSGF